MSSLTSIKELRKDGIGDEEGDLEGYKQRNTDRHFKIKKTME
jgi:hypothetical protein